MEYFVVQAYIDSVIHESNLLLFEQDLNRKRTLVRVFIPLGENGFHPVRCGMFID